MGEYDWADFVPRMKQKTFDEIQEYNFFSLDFYVALDFLVNITGTKVLS